MKRGWFIVAAVALLIIVAAIYKDLGSISGFVTLDGGMDESEYTGFNGGSWLTLSGLDIEVSGGNLVISYSVESAREGDIRVFYSLVDENEDSVISGEQSVVVEKGSNSFRDLLKVSPDLDASYKLILSIWDGSESQYMEKSVTFGKSRISGWVVSDEARKVGGWVAISSFLVVALYIIVLYLYRRGERWNGELFTSSTRNFIQFDI